MQRQSGMETLRATAGSFCLDQSVSQQAYIIIIIIIIYYIHNRVLRFGKLFSLFFFLSSMVSWHQSAPRMSCINSNIRSEFVQGREPLGRKLLGLPSNPYWLASLHERRTCWLPSDFKTLMKERESLCETVVCLNNVTWPSAWENFIGLYTKVNHSCCFILMCKGVLFSFISDKTVWERSFEDGTRPTKGEVSRRSKKL